MNAIARGKSAVGDEKQLWCAVITQALDDATWKTAQGVRGPSAAIAKTQARAWLTHPNRDFDEVCYLAGLDPERVRSFARQKIEEADRKAKEQSELTVYPGV